MEDVDEAIVLIREAHSLCPRGHPDRALSLNNLAINLFTQYSQLGAVQDLGEAIVLDREALSFYPQGHPNSSRLGETSQTISPFGTSGSGPCKTSTKPLSLTEKPSAFARKDTLIGRYL